VRGRHPIVVLWAVPRAVSTAFERMMIERGDHTVFDEPFSRHYYFGPERASSRYTEVLPGSRPTEILEQLEAAARERPVFVKDMAYHVAAFATPEFMERFVNTFLVRDPAFALPSLAEKWPDFTDDESGYAALAHVLELARAAGQDPPIVDSDDLCRDAPAVVAEYCAAVDIPYVADALTWEAGMRPEWELWPDWYEATASSTGFRPPPTTPPPKRDDPRLARAYAQCAPIYEQLRSPS
jgi:hypothetical protein